MLYSDYILITFLEQNGGWDSPDELIRQQHLILNRCGLNKERFLILGFTGFHDRKNSAVLEATMGAKWKEHYVNLREYLSNPDTISKLVLEESETDMEQGIAPDCLRVDTANFNSGGYQAIGELVYDNLSFAPLRNS